MGFEYNSSHAGATEGVHAILRWQRPRECDGRGPNLQGIARRKVRRVRARPGLGLDGRRPAIFRVGGIIANGSRLAIELIDALPDLAVESISAVLEVNAGGLAAWIDL